MKLLVVVPQFHTGGAPPGPVGGGEISLRLLLEQLARSEKIHILARTFHTKNSRESATFHLHKRQFPRIPKSGTLNRALGRKAFKLHVKELIEELEPDLVMSGTRTIAPVEEAASPAHVATVPWVRAYENFPSENQRQASGSVLKAVDQRFSRWLFAGRDRRALKRAALVLTNSQFMASHLSDTLGRQAGVVYPPVDITNFEQTERVEEPSVGFVNPCERKGFPLVLKMARAAPDLRFNVFGSRPNDWAAIEADLPNLEFHGWVEKSVEMYERTRVFIVPSQWNEPFGRVAVEALASGIPALVSSVGGLPEAVGDDRLVVHENDDPAVWVRRVRKTLEDKDFYQSVQKLGRQHIQQFSVEQQGRRLRELLAGLVP